MPHLKERGGGGMTSTPAIDILEARTATQFAALLADTIANAQTTDRALANLIHIKRAISAEQTNLEAVVDSVKKVIDEIAEETGETKWVTPSGTAKIVPASETPYIDLDAVKTQRPDLYTQLQKDFTKIRTRKSYIDIR
jgi:predicted unusual protein kinase regulating ubiquinone biosynthesis (AarF/ABC1/UbiB family)